MNMHSNFCKVWQIPWQTLQKHEETQGEEVLPDLQMQQLVQEGSAGCAQLMYCCQQGYALLGTPRVAVQRVIDVLRKGACLRI